ncbi:Uma2 family endonuclease [Candidatus Electrothrix sp.]|uniref:Uma2 family endonuclease n=1 Tax=Candidatus Electrothrix sp. TaxID=2170559 RepID=UPI004055E275
MPLSCNQSYLAYRIAKVLDQGNKYNLHIEMTLDINGTDYIPDIVLYRKEKIDFLHDKIKADKPPLLLVEILSPKQAVNEVTEKFEVYLQAGVQSCWLVIPPTKTLVLFQDMQQPRSYSSGRFTDPVIELEVAVDDIFS